jgi:hypothetical protein
MDVFQSSQWGRQLVDIMDFKLCCARHDPVNMTQASPKQQSSGMRGIAMRVKPVGHLNVDRRYSGPFPNKDYEDVPDENSCGLGIVFQLGEHIHCL